MPRRRKKLPKLIIYPYVADHEENLAANMSHRQMVGGLTQGGYMSKSIKRKNNHTKPIDAARRNIREIENAIASGGRITDTMLCKLERAHDTVVYERQSEIEKQVLDEITTPDENGMVFIPLPVRLYHGTSRTCAERILVEGIKPRGEGKPNHEDMPSAPDRVYLTTSYALTYAVGKTLGEDDKARLPS